MTVFIIYRRGSPQGMKIFRRKKDARKFVTKQDWPNNFIIRSRKIL